LLNIDIYTTRNLQSFQQKKKKKKQRARMSANASPRSPARSPARSPRSGTKKAVSAPTSSNTAASKKSSSGPRRSVAFGDVKVQSFARVQARDKVPDDGHAAALGLGAAIGKPITRRISQFEQLRDEKGRSPAKAFLKRKLSFNTRQQMLLSAAVVDESPAADDEAVAAMLAATDSSTATVSPQQLLRKRKSIIDYDREVRRIVDQRSRASGCHCASGAACRTNKCLCVKDQLGCLWDLCVCECKDCVNQFNNNDNDNNNNDADDADDNDEHVAKKKPVNRKSRK
jgi:hypothetical protein